MLDIYYLGDGAVVYVASLRKATADHFDLFLELYSELWKPKLHLLHHPPDSISKFRRNFDTKSAEKRHQVVKRYARKSTGAYRDRHVTRMMVSMHFEAIDDPGLYEPIHSMSTVGGQLCPLIHMALAQFGFGSGQIRVEMKVPRMQGRC